MPVLLCDLSFSAVVAGGVCRQHTPLACLFFKQHLFKDMYSLPTVISSSCDSSKYLGFFCPGCWQLAGVQD